MRRNLLTVAALAAGAVLMAAGARGQTTITIGDAGPVPAGDVASFDVSLTTDEDIAGTANDITFDQKAKIPRTCSKTTETLCVADTECPAGKCSKTATTSCRITGDCPAGTCSVTTATACHVNLDCPAGKCSTTTTQACRANGECPATETCNNAETCQNGETCRNAETCSGVACAVNEDINKGGTAFAFQPPGCVGDACTAVRALVLALNNVEPIPTDTVLYTCQVQTAVSADGDYPLTCSNAGASDPDGGAVVAECPNGKVTVEGTANPTSTLTSAISATDTSIPLADASAFPAAGVIEIDDELIAYTGKDGNTLTGAVRGAGGTTAAAHDAGATVEKREVVVVPTATPTTTPTASITPTPVATATVTRTGTRTPPATNTPGTPGGGRSNDDDGCAIVAPAQSSAAWMLLLPAAALLWLRRRSR